MNKIVDSIVIITFIILLSIIAFSCHLSPQYFIDKQNQKIYKDDGISTRIRIEYPDNSYEYINAYDYRVCNNKLFELDNKGKLKKVYKDYLKLYEVEEFNGITFSEEIK